ncbi:MAG: ParB/RepB/Spo0J family partition protein [Methylacidiphilaceae bacterium]|nr:ParB/RepB/Spo0J family partition protein [Candidatus Methylacidiphilaceae bacterium]
MKTFTHDVFGAKNKEDAIEKFWAYMEEHNGKRRRKPQEFTTVQRVWYKPGENWKVTYTVPNEVLRERPEKDDDEGLKYSLSQDKNLAPVQAAGTVETAKVLVTGMNPRRYFDEEKMAGLTESIRQNGILEPLIVRPKGDEYELVIGERRLKAAQVLGLESVPAVVREMTDEQVLEAMLVENLQREDLNPIEEAEAVKRYIETTKVDQKAAAERLGKSEPWITKRLQLLDLPKDLQELLTKGDLTPYHIEKLAPFCGYPVYTEIVRELKDRLKRFGGISVDSMQQMIDGLIKLDFHADRALNLSTFPHELRDRRPHFDFSQCKDCATGRRIVYETEVEGDREFCVDRRCYSDKLELAKQALEKARQTVPCHEAVSAPKPGFETPGLVKVGALLQNEAVSFKPVKAGAQARLTIEILDPSETNCDGCPAWNGGCTEGETNALNCVRHAADSEPVRKIRAEEESEPEKVRRIIAEIPSPPADEKETPAEEKGTQKVPPATTGGEEIVKPGVPKIMSRDGMMSYRAVLIGNSNGDLLVQSGPKDRPRFEEIGMVVAEAVGLVEGSEVPIKVKITRGAVSIERTGDF